MASVADYKLNPGMSMSLSLPAPMSQSAKSRCSMENPIIFIELHVKLEILPGWACERQMFIEVGYLSPFGITNVSAIFRELGYFIMSVLQGKITITVTPEI